MRWVKAAREFAGDVRQTVKNARESSDKLPGMLDEVRALTKKADRAIKTGKRAAVAGGTVGVGGVGAAGYAAGSRKRKADDDSWEEAAKNVSTKAKGAK